MVASIFLVAVLTAGASAAEAGPLSRGQRWQRARGTVTLVALQYQREAENMVAFRHYQSLGFTAGFLAEPPAASGGLGKAFLDSGTAFLTHQGAFGRCTPSVWDSPLHVGHFEGDESVPDSLRGRLGGFPSYSMVAATVRAIRRRSPKLLIIGSIYPSFCTEEGQIESYLKTVEPDVFTTTGAYCTQPIPSSGWYARLGSIRRACLSHRTPSGAAGIPYWLWLSHATAMGVDVNDPRGAEGKHRQQLYSCLAFGFTGIMYFTFNHKQSAWAGCLVTDPQGKARATPFSDLIRKTNREVRNLGLSLVWLRSTDVRWVPGRRRITAGGKTAETANPVPPGVLPFEWFSNDPYQWTVETDGRGDGQNVLIGYFKDEKASRYFLVANQSWHRNQRVTFTFDFAKSGGRADVRGLVHMDKRTGLLERIGLSSPRWKHVKDRQYRFSVELAPGDGELYMYDDGTDMQTASLPGPDVPRAKDR